MKYYYRGIREWPIGSEVRVFLGSQSAPWHAYPGRVLEHSQYLGYNVVEFDYRADNGRQVVDWLLDHELTN